MNSSAQGMAQLARVLGRIEDALCAIALGSVAVIITGQVFTRYLLNYTPHWSEELSRYLIVWTIFIGMAIGVRKNIHIGVDACIRLAPPRLRIGLEVLLNVLGAAVSAVLIWLAIAFIQDTIAYDQLSPAMQIPMWLPYLAMPVGLAFAVVHFVHDVVKLFTTGEQPHSADDLLAQPPPPPAAQAGEVTP